MSIAFESKARDEMLANGYSPRDIIMDGKLRRFSTKAADRNDRAGWYVFCNDGKHCWGAYGDWREGTRFKFNGVEPSVMSSLERLEYKKLHESLKRKQEAERRKNAEYAARIAAKTIDRMNKTPEAIAAHPYVIAKKIRTHANVGVLMGLLCVPIYNEGELVGIQRISGAERNNKKISFGTPMRGSWHLLGTIENDIIIAEGYATAASLYEATGTATVVAFFAGNLQAVAAYFRKKYPKANIVIAADDDGNNIGKQKAEAAASEIRGVVRYLPENDTTPRLSDFNDLAAHSGLDSVKSIIYPPPVVQEHFAEPIPYIDDEEILPFKVLGRFGGSCYYIPADGYIYDYAPIGHGKAVLLSLASNQYWIKKFPNTEGGIYTDEAVSWLLELSQDISFDPSLRRGRGAWKDRGRILVHQGTHIMDVVTGEETPANHFQSEYFYPKAPAINQRRVHAAKSSEASQLLEIFKYLPLENSINNYLIAGWLVCAHISGILDWRPHIWITGPKGSGKSWTMTHLLLPLLGKNVLHVQSSSTEAGIRQSLGGDTRPILFDEAEGTGQKERDRLQRVLELARQASSEGGGIIAKGSVNGRAMAFQIRSCFCFSSIASSVTQNSDKSRITQIEINATRFGSPDDFKKLKDLTNKVITPEFCNAFYWRCVENADVIRQNAITFSEAAGEIFDDRRAGDQLGTLIAGAYSLVSSKIVTAEFARKWIEDKKRAEKWRPFLEENEEQNDEKSLLDSILQASANHLGRPIIIGQLVRDVYYDVDAIEKIKTLGSYGIKIVRSPAANGPDEGDGHGGENGPSIHLIIANRCDNLRRCLKETAFAENWAKALQRMEGAKKTEGVVRFSTGVVSRATMIDMETIIPKDAHDEPEKVSALPLESDYDYYPARLSERAY